MAEQYKCNYCGDIAIRNHHTCKNPREFWIQASNMVAHEKPPVTTKSHFHVQEVIQCYCDPEVGFFCAHCANENNYIQDLQNQIVALQDKLNKFQINLTVCKNDYWFMINLLERYSTDKDQAMKDCIDRMKFIKGIFNILEDDNNE